MIPEIDAPEAGDGHVWMVFGDLMAGLFGLFVFFFIGVVVYQIDLATQLTENEAARARVEAARTVEQAKLAELEAAKAAADARMASLQIALARPLADGTLTLSDGRIGIAGAVLFDLYSADLSEAGAALLAEVAGPLASWLRERDEMVMVGGFTDDLPIHGAEPRFTDNWQLSTERALTVVRALAEAGLPAERLYAAGFGAHHPTAPNSDEAGRARNRRVEIVPQARGRR